MCQPLDVTAVQKFPQEKKFPMRGVKGGRGAHFHLPYVINVTRPKEDQKKKVEATR